MFFEARIRTIRERYADFKTRNTDYARFEKYFFGVKLSGVLTQPGEEIDPTEKGQIIVASIDTPLKRKLEWGQRPTREEEQRIRQAAWSAIDGNYTSEQTPEGFKISLTIDTPDTLSYMTTYVGDMAAFLEHGSDGDERYPATQSIILSGESFIYIFPQVQSVPEKLRKLHIYTRAVDRSKIDTRFTKLSFALHPPTPPPSNP